VASSSQLKSLKPVSAEGPVSASAVLASDGSSSFGFWLSAFGSSAGSSVASASAVLDWAVLDSDGSSSFGFWLSAFNSSAGSSALVLVSSDIR
jgi:hypothetical protein